MEDLCLHPKQSMTQSSEHTELLATLEIEFEELSLQKVKLNYYKESSSYKVTGVSFTQQYDNKQK